MTKMIDVKVKDQCNKILSVKAALRDYPENSRTEQLTLPQRIAHIVVDGEIILPSIELLYESQQTSHIYKIVA